MLVFFTREMNFDRKAMAMTLNELKIGSSAVITAVGGDGYELTLRVEEAKKIEVEGVSA